MIQLGICRELLNPVECRNFREMEIKGVSNHSGEIGPGFLFCAIRGAKIDGRRFISQAIQTGAVAIVSDDPSLELPLEIPHLIVANTYHAWGLLCEAFCGFPAQKMHLHAITGTNGKTTTAFLLRKLIAEGRGEKCGLISTIEYDPGDGSPARESARTTPDAMRFQQIMTEMQRNNCRHVVLEASSHGLHQKRMGNAAFETMIFSNLTGDHLDYHHDMESYYQAKKLLFTEHVAQNGHAIVNVDDPYGKRLANELKNNVVTFSLKGNADARVTDIQSTAQRTSFILNFHGAAISLETTLTGLYNISNLTSAVLAALLLGIKAERVAEILKEPFSVPGRLESFHLQNGASAFVDYAHTDDALERVLTALRPLCKGRLIAVFGCGGDRDRTKRPRMAGICGKLADMTVITSDNPRTENPESIIKEIESGMPSGADYMTEPDREKAIRKAVEFSKKDDVILVAGKGHETYQEVNSVQCPFDDRNVLKKFI